MPIGWARAHVDLGLLVHRRSDGSIGVGDSEAEYHDRSKQDGDIEQRSIAQSPAPALGKDSHGGEVVVWVLTRKARNELVGE